MAFAAVDDIGTELVFDRPPRRIVSLVVGSTEPGWNSRAKNR